ncbi:MAG: YigZ family protein [Spirochaetia bacterium]|jgi:uncharacterized YigZ family protein|nr:YigZ family protein [Spirochaetia bacterium]
MLVPKGRSLESIEIKKSRFISKGMYVASAEEAKEIVKATRNKYPDSSHVVHAFLSGPGSEIFGFSDDREPSGTAGRPVLEVLKGSGITNIIVLVVRYFGGTKLGTGGLVKAYTVAAQRAIEHLAVEELVSKTFFHINLSYELYEQVRKLLKFYSAEIKEPIFDTGVHISGSIPEKNLGDANYSIQDISAGKVKLIVENIK